MNYPYQVLGATVPQMLGRGRLLQRLERHLLRPSPAHVPVVGPRLYGKSVLLSHVTKTMTASGHFAGVFYVDFRHSPPQTDSDFRRRFADAMKSTVAGIDANLSSYIVLDDENLHELLTLVVQELHQRPARLLAILDGFDHVRPGTGLTRNLLDQLRALTQHGSLFLVTGSRRTLRELCENEASRVSDFHEIFEQPVVVGPFDDADWDDVFAPLTAGRITLDGSARKEIANWSGGVPVLAIALLSELVAKASDGATVTKAEVDAAAESLLDSQLVSSIWADCDVAFQGDVAMLAAKKADGLLLSELAEARVRALEGRGFGARSGNRVRASCQLIARYAVQHAPAAADLKRLFGARDGFDANVRSVLEHRAAQVLGPKTDPDLRGFILNAVRDLEPNPELALKWVRSIASRVLALIWEAELGPDQKLPDAWLDEWKQAGERLQWLDGGQRLPRRQGAQCNALRLATGADKIRPLAKHATKPTALLVDALQSIGDFGQHRDDFPESAVTKGFAAAIVLSAIELVESLTRDLEGTASS